MLKISYLKTVSVHSMSLFSTSKLVYTGTLHWWVKKQPKRRFSWGLSVVLHHSACSPERGNVATFTSSFYLRLYFFHLRRFAPCYDASEWMIPLLTTYLAGKIRNLGILLLFPSYVTWSAGHWVLLIMPLGHCYGSPSLWPSLIKALLWLKASAPGMGLLNYLAGAVAFSLCFLHPPHSLCLNISETPDPYGMRFQFLRMN